MAYVRPGLVNKPNKTVKIRVVAVCDVGVSGGLGLVSFCSDAAQGKMGVNEQAVWVFLPKGENVTAKFPVCLYF